MFKPVIVANKSWWVPESNSLMLAVKCQQPEDYHQAILWKMETLVDKAGLPQAEKTANRILRQEGALPLDKAENSEHLVSMVLENSLRIALAIRAGEPEKANPAPEDVAKQMVEEQKDLDWENFLT